MRWLAAVLLVALHAPVAGAKIVMMDPPIVRFCQLTKSWHDLTGCLQKHGNMTSQVERTIGKAHLLRLTIRSGGTSFDAGLALYTEDGKGIHLAGLREMMTDESSRSLVLAATEVTINGHAGFRIDLGEERPAAVSLDDVTNRSAIQIVRRSLYCSGIGWNCTEVITSCDVLVDGRTYNTFRGTVTIAKNTITIRGDRTVAGGCAPGEQVSLGWPEPKS